MLRPSSTPTGPTAAWPPNKEDSLLLRWFGSVEPSIGTGDIDTDIISVNQNDGGPTFAAFTARVITPAESMCWSVMNRPVRQKHPIAGMVWRVGTIINRKIVSADAY